MKNYKPVSLEKAYKLLNTGAIILVGTVDKAGLTNLTPIAWNTLVDYEPVTRLLFVCEKGHKTYENICSTSRFVVILPHASQADLVIQLGSGSGREGSKTDKLNIPVFKSEKNQFPVPEDSIAYLECNVYRVLDEGGVSIIFGEVEHAMVDTQAFTDRLLSETEAGKTLHHLGGKQFNSPGDKII
jgi:flavin reductase (DIM6/NTAB) family NADH-FMN oxidoreductase RutF